MAEAPQPRGVPAPRHDHPNQVRIASGMNVIAGLYLLISAWSAGVTMGNVWNNVVAGILVAVFAASRVAGAAGRWASWLDALIGGWVILSPWVYNYAGTEWMWNSVVVGIVIAVLGIWSALAGEVRRPVPA